MSIIFHHLSTSLPFLYMYNYPSYISSSVAYLTSIYLSHTSHASIYHIHPSISCIHSSISFISFISPISSTHLIHLTHSSGALWHYGGSLGIPTIDYYFMPEIFWQHSQCGLGTLKVGDKQYYIIMIIMIIMEKMILMMMLMIIYDDIDDI